MDLLNVVIRADTTGADNATTALDKTTAAAGRTQTATERLRREVDGATRVMNMFRGAMGGILAALGLRELGQAADAWSELQARATNAVGGVTQAGGAIMERLEQMARRTYSALDQTAESWLSGATNLNALNVGIQDQLDLVETVNNALVVSATRGQRAESVQRAWANALALGTLRGTNLNAVLTGSDRLAQALADSMGVNVNELRAMGAAGEITRAQMLGVTSQLERLREEADAMPATLSDARQIWVNTFTAIVGMTDQALGASENLGASLISLADTVRSGADFLIRAAVIMRDVLGGALTFASEAASALGVQFDWVAALIVAGAGTAGFAVTALSAVLATTLVGAIKAVGTALLANPLGLIVAGVVAAITAVFVFRDQIKQVLGFDVVEVAQNAANWIVGSFDLAFRNIQSIWDAFPDVLREIAGNAANGFIGGIEFMVNKAVDGFNTIIDAANNVARFFGADWVAENLGWGTGQFARASHLEFDRVDWGGGGAMAQLDLQMALNRHIVRNRDYMGEIGEALGEAWENAEGVTASLEDMVGPLDGAAAGAEDVGGALSAANDNARALGRGLEDVATFGDLLQQSFSGLGSGLWNALKKGESLLDVLLGKVDALIGKLFDNAFDNLLFGTGAGMGGGGIAGLLASLFLPGFSHGGAGIVGGSGTYVPGAPDNTLFVARAQKGEPFAFGPQAITGIGGAASGNSAQVAIQNHYTISGTMTDKDVANMVRAANRQTAEQVENSIKQKLPGWQTNVQIHGAA